MESSQFTVENRVRFLDALRGIAVLCIYIANIAYFSGYIFFGPNERYPWALWSPDESLDFIFFTLIDGKFYTIFSLLFGIGCAVQYERVTKRGLDFKPFFRRRMFWLLVIGLIHLCLFWLGDILTLYALLGFVLLWFVETPSRKLLPWAVVLLLMPILNDLIKSIPGLDYPQFFPKLSRTIASRLGVADQIQPTTYLRISDWQTFFKANLSNWPIRVEHILDEGRIFKVLAIFLIGLWAGRKIFHENLLGNTTLLKKVAFWGILVGIPLSAFRTYIEFYRHNEELMQFVKTIVYALGTVPMALGYAAALALLYRRKPTLLSVFEPVGKMALTNYLSHTLISIAIFYGLGCGLAGKFGFTIILGIALTVFALQTALSTLYLRRFSQGPAEWFWRRAAKTGNT